MQSVDHDTKMGVLLSSTTYVYNSSARVLYIFKFIELAPRGAKPVLMYSPKHTHTHTYVAMKLHSYPSTKYYT